jgi:pantoate--beta-alanine ligase
MGFLHEGHLSLVELARRKAQRVAVSLFVNPLQFAPGEDLETYPRALERDVVLLGERGADLVFYPSVAEMYPAGDPQVTVDPGPMGQLLCGAFRPTHFRGVLTVVARLFGLFRPDVAVFGQKDYQQAVLIRRMVQDLELGVEVLLGPVVREADGLAMSSRNAYLSSRERRDAVGLRRALDAAQEAFQGGERSPAALEELLAGEIQAFGGLALQYGRVVHPDTLEQPEEAAEGTVIAVAAHCGVTRLIDNHILTL